MKFGFCIVLFFIAKVSFASEKDLYKFLWLDQDKKVFVLQNKLLPKNKSLFFDLGYTSDLTGKFQDTTGIKISAGYYFTEELGLELVYGQYSNSDNSAFDTVKLVNGIEPFIRRPLDMTLLMFNWAPFYGKINTFNKIFYFDIILGLGTGSYKMESNLKTAKLSSTVSKFEEETYTPIVGKLEFKLQINKRFHLGAEVYRSFIKAQTPKSSPGKTDVTFDEYTLKFGVSF